MKSTFTFLLCFLLLGRLNSFSQTQTVCASGCGYSTIQAAVNAASNGDVILVNVNGAITESGITVNKNITIRGLGMNTTFIQGAATRGAATSRVFYISGGSVNIENLTIRYGKETSNALQNGSGSGMLIDGTGTSVTLNNVNIKDNDCVTFTGAGITLTGTSTVLNIYNSSFDGNTVASTSQSGGALYLSAGTVVAKNTVFNNNTVPSSGGAIFLSGSVTASFTNCTFSNNSSTAGSGGVLYGNSGNPVFTNCTFNNNTASGQGGALRVGPATLTNCTFYQNTASQGGALFRSGSSYTSPLSFVNCTVVSNSATGASGGGGLYYNSPGGSIVMVNSVFSGNTASTGADMYVSSGAYLTTNQKNYVVSPAFGASATTFTYNSGANLSGVLANNGGLTKTMAITAGSVLINNGAASVAGVTIPDKDQRNYQRSGTLDIGAYEYSATDALSISYTTLADVTSANNRTLAATISDNIGLPTSGATLPRIYFKKSTGTVWASTAGSLASGTATSGTWNFTIDHSLLGTIATGDQVQYFVVAQDNTTGGFAKSNSAGLVAGDVNSIGSYPTPNSYTINLSSLPVTFLSFTVVKKDQQATLTWVTSNEVNADGFIIERSADGGTWQSLSFVPATGSGSLTTLYNFIDMYPQTGINYYRLKQVDVNGSFTYSVTRKIEIGAGSANARVYPNPVVGGSFTVELAAGQAKSVSYSLINSAGAVVRKGMINNGIERINVNGLGSGIYLLQLSNGDKVKIQKR
jgi:predicted outer membrane repeat protein